jgi:hypothetical protein
MVGYPDVYGDEPKTDEKPRCWRCEKLLAEKLTRPWVIVCARCKAKNNKD